MDLVDIFGFDFVRWVGFEFEIDFLDNFYLWVAQFLDTQTSILMTQNSNKNSIQQAMKESLTHMLKIEDNQRN